MSLMIDVQGLSKTFTLHNQGGIELSVLDDIYLQANAGECTVLFGESGSGKSTLLRTLYGNYLPTAGAVLIKQQGQIEGQGHTQNQSQFENSNQEQNKEQPQWLDIATATPHALLKLRKESIGYVSQFLRVIPRIGALDVVMQPLIERQVDAAIAREKAANLLTRLHIPERLWSLPPSTFSGGEQQRINITRGFIVDYPILLLDEPTASLDANNSAVVVALIEEALARGTAVIGIFHDADVREKVATRVFHVGQDSDHPQPPVNRSPSMPTPEPAL